MKTPENLVKAVERLEPQVILLLDTNTIMDNPRLESYEIAAAGPFLLVVPQVVNNELLGLTFNNDPETKRKAERAQKHLGNLYERGNAADGIDVGNDRWMITVTAPRPTGTKGTPIEDDQIWKTSHGRGCRMQTTMTPGKGGGGFQTRPYRVKDGGIVIANWREYADDRWRRSHGQLGGI